MNMANASPSTTMLSRIVRSLFGKLICQPQSKNARSISRSIVESPLLSWSRGPVPIRSFASVELMPARYELFARS